MRDVWLSALECSPVQWPWREAALQLLVYFHLWNTTTWKALPKNTRMSQSSLWAASIVLSAGRGSNHSNHMKSVLQQANVFLFWGMTQLCVIGAECACVALQCYECTADQNDTFRPSHRSDSDVMETVVRANEMSTCLFISYQLNSHYKVFWDLTSNTKIQSCNSEPKHPAPSFFLPRQFQPSSSKWREKGVLIL